MALTLYKDHDIGLDLKESLYALAPTTIEPCSTLF